jgi:CMP-N-acetylneuraminic acid synthetase
MSIIALIPARGGSKRLPGKNIKPLAGHPLIAYTIQAAMDSGIFDGIYCSSDSEEIGRIAEYYGSKWIERPKRYASYRSPDREWIRHALKNIIMDNEPTDSFVILRPTSPFRTRDTIIRARNEYRYSRWMKAVETVKQHPSKMWNMTYSEYGELIATPLCEGDKHLLPMQSLDTVYIQNGCIEIRQARTVRGYPPPFYQPFLTEGYEGFDINTIEDWILAEALIERGLAKLPEVTIKPWG